MDRVDVILVGFGNVGQALVTLLQAKAQEILEQRGITVRVTGIATARHGIALDPEGLDPEHALDLVRAGGSLSQLSRSETAADTLTFIERSGADVLFENTPVDYHSGQPAVDHLRTGLRKGMHVITANKGPVVHAHSELTQLAQRAGKHFAYEATVMDGAPIFSLWQEALPGATLKSFRGILNSTTNFLLTSMEEGCSFSEALAEAQGIGIAEADPAGDIEGWDAAVKVAALVTVIMGIPLQPQQVHRRGIAHLRRKEVEQAGTAGERWKLICSAQREGVSVQARVQPERISSADPLYHVGGTSSAISFVTDVLGELTLVERDPGPHTTAYGLLADFLRSVGWSTS